MLPGSLMVGWHHHDFHSFLSYLANICSAGETGDASHCHHAHMNNFVNWLPTSLNTLYQLHRRCQRSWPLTHACTQHCSLNVNMCVGVRTMSHRLFIIRCFAHSHKSSQSSISLSGCAAPRLRWGRWGRPCPPLCWSVGGSFAAPPPWTEWSAAGCLSAPPPPHRRAPPECWPTTGRGRERG